MFLDKEVKIESICADKKQKRVLLERPFLDLKDDGRPLLVASNGAACAVVPVTAHSDDTEGFIEIEALRTARKKPKVSGRPILLAKDKLEFIDGEKMNRTTLRDLECNKMYDWRFCTRGVKRSDTKIRIGINTECLKNLADAMGCRTVVLDISSNEEMIVVHPGGESYFEQGIRGIQPAVPDAIGYIMPSRAS